MLARHSDGLVALGSKTMIRRRIKRIVSKLFFVDFRLRRAQCKSAPGLDSHSQGLTLPSSIEKRRVLNRRLCRSICTVSILAIPAGRPALWTSCGSGEGDTRASDEFRAVLVNELGHRPRGAAGDLLE